jgi:hypothetical protein
VIPTFYSLQCCKEIKWKNIETYSQDLELDLFKEDG